METSFTKTRNKRGDWQPEKPLRHAPVLELPIKPAAILKWLFGWPGYFFPWGVVYMVFPIIAWAWFTPTMESMRSLAPGWIAFIALRNFAFLMIFAGGFHLWLYVKQAQGTDWKYSVRWPTRDNPIFMFGNQNLDNLFWSVVSAVPIWTAYEVISLWIMANGYIPSVSFSAHPIYCALLFLLIPMLRDFHFYWVHRLSHWGPIYKYAHYLHHNNVNYGPLTGVSMHPLEHLLYFSGAIMHWIIPSHPIHAIWHVMHAGITPALGHLGYERIVLKDGVAVQSGDFYHYLHHKHFECNYGIDGPFPFDRWFGTLHDGTKQSEDRMNERFRIRAEQKAKAEAAT